MGVSMQEYRRITNNQNGVTAVVLAIALVALLGFAALAVDIGYLYSARNELQNAADAAALAATRQLGRIYAESSLTSRDFSSAANASHLSSIYSTATTVAGKNIVAGSSVSISAGDIAIGQWNPETRTLSATLVEPDAVQVTARRDAASGQAVALFFARVLGIQTADVSAIATAALSGLSQINEGELTIPVGISEEWFSWPREGGFCGQDIKFYPTGGMEGCAGWTTFDSQTGSTTQLRKIFQGLLNSSYHAPGATIYETQFRFDGGVKASAIFSNTQTDITDLYNRFKDANGNWSTYVVVYRDESACGQNPNGWITVVGFARATIYQVLEAPDKIIRARVECNRYDPDNRGGGGYYGLRGAIPGLVR
jgi:Flp pilus assembly protein TadG